MSSVLSLLGWTFLPNLVTGWIQSIYYGITIRAGDPHPRPGTPRYAEDRRRIHILVVTCYLLYTIYEADYELRRAGSFYTDLGVALDASERDIKSRFRRLAALYHPDKAGANGNNNNGGPTGGGTDNVNAYFIHLKTASDTLVDPARRFAYDRFGPDVVAWRGCVTVRDFVLRGCTALAPYYVAAAAALYGLGLLGYLDWGRHERWLALAAMLVFELHAVTRPGRPPLFERFVNPVVALLMRAVGGIGGSGTLPPPYLPFQAVALARKLCVTLYIAFSQIGPLLAADTAGGQVVIGGGVGGGQKGGVDQDEALLRQGLDRLEAMARTLDMDATRLLQLEMVPFAGDREAAATLTGKVREWLVQNTIRSDPMVIDAVGRSVQKRRVDAPAGARGNR